jgi:inner membrane protein
MLGKKIGNKGQLLGAIAGTIPDLDIFLNFLAHTELEKLTIHRGYSHSLFTHLFLALPFAWATWKAFKGVFQFKWWYSFWLLGFVTHALLDSFTTYGTQLLLPFTDYLVGFNNIAVVDVFWTFPFMLLLITCLFFKRDNPRRRKFAVASVTYAVLYMGMTFFNKYQVHSKMTDSLHAQEIRYDELATSPNFFHNFLWSGVAMTQDSIYFSEYSILQKESEIQWSAVPRHLKLIEHHPAKEEIKVIKWFSQGKYLAQESGDTLRMFVAKWGRMDYRETDPSKSIFFYFNIYKEDGQWKATQSRPDQANMDIRKVMAAMYRRIWTSELAE